MPGDCFSTGPHACKAELLQTHHETKILHILLHDDVVKKDQMFSIKTDVMLPHHMRGGGVAAPQQAGSDGAERAGKSNESVDTTSSA